MAGIGRDGIGGLVLAGSFEVQRRPTAHGPISFRHVSAIVGRACDQMNDLLAPRWRCAGLSHRLRCAWHRDAVTPMPGLWISMATFTVLYLVRAGVVCWAMWRHIVAVVPAPPKEA